MVATFTWPPWPPSYKMSCNLLILKPFVREPSKGAKGVKLLPKGAKYYRRGPNYFFLAPLLNYIYIYNLQVRVSKGVKKTVSTRTRES